MATDVTDARGGRPSAWMELSTEERNPATLDLDRRDTLGIVTALNDEDAKAAPAVRAILPQIAALVDDAAPRVRRGGRVHYFGAGTSGRLGVIDAAELRPTFNLPDGVVIGHHAGGPAALIAAVENLEDQWDAGRHEAADVGPDDVAIGIAASGRTPFVGGALERAREAGAITGLIACAREPELAPYADHVLVADTGPEALAGSTRLKAGTAQKIMLNTFSTALMVRLGKTWSNLMVSVVASNDKLRRRTVRILMEATGDDEETCTRALEAADGDLKVAIVTRLGGVDVAQARAALEASGGVVAQALA
ncbi:N-acetylmuramic acid 6-phosphate etherase [Mariniluteicoccus flavus]